MRIYPHSKTDILYLDFVSGGKRHRKSTGLKNTPANMKLVEKELAPKIQASIAMGTFEMGDKKAARTLGAFADEFFKNYKNEVAQRTYSSRLSWYEKHIKPLFKDRLITSIKPMELSTWQNDLYDKYKYNTVVQYRSVFMMILEKAVDNDIIEKNPFLKAKLKVRKELFDDMMEEEDDVTPFNEEEIKQLMEKAEDTMKYFIPIMYSCGARPSELAALTWDDVDFKNKRIRINKTLKSHGKVGKPKTRSSIRDIDMLPLAEKYFKLYYEEIKKFKQKRVFINRYRVPYNSYYALSIAFKKIAQAAKVTNGTLYNLRHTFASTMIKKGVDIVWVSKMLGHADVNITYRVYVKFIQVSEKERFENIEKFGKNLAHL